MPESRNKPRLVQLCGFTRMERHKSVALLREAIFGSHGWITDFHEFSNISLCIEFEIPADSLPVLAEAMIAAEVRLGTLTERMLDGLETGQAGEPVPCTLQVKFIHDEPDLRRRVLAVPG